MKSHAQGPKLIWAGCVIAVCAASVALVMAQGNPARNVLWMIVHTQCVPNEEQHSDPQPCTRVDLGGGEAQGFALLKDIRGKSQYLLIPTARVAGIENQDLLAPGAPNYFEDAWKARGLLGDALHKALPREDISLAINSAKSRSQDQLHIHIDCVRADVRAAVRQHIAEVGPQWAPFSAPLAGQHYEATWVPGENLDGHNPFQMLAAGVSGAANDMGDRTLVVIGASKPGNVPGFVIFEDEVNRLRGNLASGEELQDHSCAVASDAEATAGAAGNN